MTELEMLQEIQTSTESVFDGRLLHVKRDSVRLPNGKSSTRELIRHIGAVAVIPVCDDGCVIVERQFRYPMDEVITEIPAGKLDSKEEDHLEAAQRELREETGYTAATWESLGSLYVSPAYTDEVIHLYMARDLQLGAQELDEGEFLDVKKVPLEELVEEVMTGKIPDAKTQIAILKAARILGK